MPRRLTLAHAFRTGQSNLPIQFHGENPPPSLSPERVKVADFYAARSGIIPPLPWPTFAPPLSMGEGDALLQFNLVVSGTSIRFVVTTVVPQIIVTRAANQRIIANTVVSAAQFVVTRTTIQIIIAQQTVQKVVAAQSVKLVVTFGTY